MNRPKDARNGFRGLLLSTTVVLGAAGMLLGSGPAFTQGKEKINHYVGASKCKSCHESEEKGNQYGAWSNQAHAKAFERLASPEAKEVAKKLGIEDPQTSPACLKCHVTAHGLPEEHIKKGFNPKQGVQCESCHGPGEEHQKARMAAVAKGVTGKQEIPAGEIVTIAPAATCRGCHSKDSPTYKPFCYYERLEKIRHLDPQNHTPEELAAKLVCGCGDACKCDEECTKECPVPKGEAKK
jgi:hypothetical protein